LRELRAGDDAAAVSIEEVPESLGGASVQVDRRGEVLKL
jgi:hypothetical protein